MSSDELLLALAAVGFVVGVGLLTSARDPSADPPRARRVPRVSLLVAVISGLLVAALSGWLVPSCVVGALVGWLAAP